MTQKFRVGDEVRILGLSIFDADEIGKTGVVIKAKEALWDGGFGVIVEIKKGKKCIYTFKNIELVDEKPTQGKPKKNERISALESQIAELTAKVAALEKVGKPAVKLADTAEVFFDGKSIGKVKAVEACVLSANEQRKAIIAEAKAFVEETSTFVNTDYSWQQSPSPKHREAGTLKVKFEVNAEKRTVVALVYLKFHGGLAFKAIAKCAPDDVFNADIGKAIALGRALGLDVKRFEQAVKPTEVVVGMGVYEHTASVINRVTKMKPEHNGVTQSYGGGLAFTTDYGWLAEGQVDIVSDTEAQY